MSYARHRLVIIQRVLAACLRSRIAAARYRIIVPLGAPVRRLEGLNRVLTCAGRCYQMFHRPREGRAGPGTQIEPDFILHHPPTLAFTSHLLFSSAEPHLDVVTQGTPASNAESYKWLAEDSAKAKVTVSSKPILVLKWMAGIGTCCHQPAAALHDIEHDKSGMHSGHAPAMASHKLAVTDSAIYAHVVAKGAECASSRGGPGA